MISTYFFQDSDQTGCNLMIHLYTLFWRSCQISTAVVVVLGHGDDNYWSYLQGSAALSTQRKLFVFRVIESAIGMYDDNTLAHVTQR